MADKKISQLTATTVPLSADLLAIVTGGVTKKITYGNLMAGFGTVTSFSAGDLSPLFTTTESTVTTTPALSFTLTSQNNNLVFAGPTGGGPLPPTFRALVAGDIPSLSQVYWAAGGNSFGADRVLGTMDAFSLHLYVNTAEKATIFYSATASINGNFGINQTSPTAKLHIVGYDDTSSNYALKIDNSTPSGLLYVRNDRTIGFNASPDTALAQFLFSGTIAGTNGVHITHTATGQNVLNVSSGSTGQTLVAAVAAGAVSGTIGFKSLVDRNQIAAGGGNNQYGFYSSGTGVNWFVGRLCIGENGPYNFDGNNLTITTNNSSGETNHFVCYNDSLSSGNYVMVVTKSGLTGLGITSPTAVLDIKAGTATASTAPIKLNPGVLLTTPEIGTIEYVDNATTGTFYVTVNVAGVPTRQIFSGGGGLTSPVLASQGGTGIVNNVASTITITGSFASTLVVTGAYTYTFPTATATLIANNLGISGGTTLIGGTAVGDALSLQGTSGNGTATSGAVIFKVGNNGATESARILNNGKFLVGRSTISTLLYDEKFGVYGNVNGSVISMFENTNTGASAYSGLVISNGVSLSSFVHTSTGNTFGGAYPQDGFLFSTGGAGGMNVSSYFSSIRFFTGAGTQRVNINDSGRTFFGGSTSATALIHIAAGTATASTSPLKFTSGTNLTTAEAGAMEYNGTNLFFTRTGTTRQTVLTGNVITTEVIVSDTSITVNIAGTDYKLLARA